MEGPMGKKCMSIRSKKKPDEQCGANATKGDFCSRHSKSKILWAKRKYPMTRKQSGAINKIYKFWILYGRRRLIKESGPVYSPEISENDKDILTHEPIQTIPLKYRFCYKDSSAHIWMFDLRFFVQLMHYGNEIKNPFSQEILPQPVIQRLQKRVEKLRSQKVPIIYADDGELTPEQVWNQKVLDVFLKINSLGYGVNVLWFDTMGVRTHELFYRNLYNLWTYVINISDEEKEKLIPGHSSGRSPLFRWTPSTLRSQELKWWRKTNLGLIQAFVSRSKDKIMQSSGALYILTALANSHRHVAEAFPWLTSD